MSFQNIKPRRKGFDKRILILVIPSLALAGWAIWSQSPQAKNGECKATALEQQRACQAFHSDDAVKIVGCHRLAQSQMQTCDAIY